VSEDNNNNVSKDVLDMNNYDFVIPGDSDNITYIDKAQGLFYVGNDGVTIFPV